MSAPGAPFVVPSSTQSPQTNVKLEIKPTRRRPVDAKLFKIYVPRDGDFVYSKTGIGACQVMGSHLVQQDNCTVKTHDAAKFPTGSSNVENLMLSAWDHVKKPFSPESGYTQNNGTTAMCAVAHLRKLYFCSTGDSSFFLIVRNKKTNKILLLSRLQYRYHKTTEPSENIRYGEDSFLLDNGHLRLKNIYGEGGVLVTRSIGDPLYRVHREPDFGELDLSAIPKDCIIDLLAASDGIDPIGSEAEIEAVLNKLGPEVTLAEQAEHLVAAALNVVTVNNKKDNTTAYLVRLTDGTTDNLNPLIVSLGDGHGVQAENVSQAVTTGLPSAICQLAAQEWKETEVQQANQASIEKIYQDLRLNGQQFYLNSTLVNTTHSPLQRITDIRESLKTSIYECKHILDCQRSKLSIQQSSSGSVMIKETDYCTLDLWDGEEYVTTFLAQLDVVLLLNANGAAKIQAFFSLDKRLAVGNNLGVFKRLDNFTQDSFLSEMKRIALKNHSNSAWEACLDKNQLAVIRKAAEAKQNSSEDVLKDLWQDNRALFISFYTFLASYDGDLKKFYSPENRFFHDQILYYQQVSFSLVPFQRLMLLQKMLKSLNALRGEKASCWPLGFDYAKYISLLDTLQFTIEREQMFVSFILPNLPTDSRLATRLPAKETSAEGYPTCCDSHWKKMLCCFLGVSSASWLFPAMVGNLTTTLVAGSAGTLTGFTNPIFSKVLESKHNKEAKELLTQLNNTVELSESPVPTKTKEMKAEEIIIKQYIGAIVREDKSRNKILEKNINVILSYFEYVKDSIKSNDKIKINFGFFAADPVFNDFIKTSPEQDRYKKLLLEFNRELYDIIHPRNAPLPGHIP